ncbi:MAG: glycosyltransferase, partial [Candidatus Heimdallarchaeaceae archaeon]
MVSAIIPVHNEEDNVIPVYRELKEILQKVTTDFEIIFVDDGSKDATLDKLLSLKS